MALLATAVAAALGADRDGNSERRARVVLHGSSVMEPFVEQLMLAFRKIHPDIDVEVQGGGSGHGIAAVAQEMADIGMVSRDLKPEEKALSQVLLGWDGLALVVRKTNPIDGLTREQARDLFSGKIRNWKEVGGAVGGVTVVNREQGSQARATFTEFVMGETRMSRDALTQPSNGGVRQTVARDTGAIGYMSLGLVGTEVKVLKIDGNTAAFENLRSGKYKLSRPLTFVYKGKLSEAAQDFVDFALSPDGQRILADGGLVGLNIPITSSPASSAYGR